MSSARRRALVGLAGAAMILGSGGGLWAATGSSAATQAPAAQAAPGHTARAHTALTRTATPRTTTARCDARWGTGAKGTLPVQLSDSHIEGVRAGRHTCFDRLVIDVSDELGAGGYSLRYVPAVYEKGSGDRVRLRGRAAIEVIVGAPSHDDQWRSTYVPRDLTEVVPTRGFGALRQVAWAGSFEGQTTLGLGVAERLPMRAFVLTAPGRGDRLVIDIAHR